MSAAHYMVSIKTDMPKNTRPEDLKDRGNVAKKKKPSDPTIVSEWDQHIRLQALERGAENVKNKKETFDTLVQDLANKYKTEPVKSDTEKSQETRVIKWMGHYLNAILELKKNTTSFISWTGPKLPNEFDRDLPEYSANQMKNWATSKVDEDVELGDEAQFIADEDEEIDLESDDEDEFAIDDEIERDDDGEILYSFKNFKFLVDKLINTLHDEGGDIEDNELQFLSNVVSVQKYAALYIKSLDNILKDPVIQKCIQKLLKSIGLKKIIENLLSLWQEDEYLLKLLEDLHFMTEDTLIADASFLTETKKKLQGDRIASSITEKDMEKALRAKDAERGLTDIEIRAQIALRKELKALGDQNGISSREAQPEETGDGNRKGSRLRTETERLRGDHFEVPLANLDSGIRNIDTRINNLRQMRHFLRHVKVRDSPADLKYPGGSPVKKITRELIPKWLREVTAMIDWGRARIQSREERYRSEAKLLTAQISQRSALAYKYDMTRFFLFRRNKQGCWDDISGKAEDEAAAQKRELPRVLFDSWHEASIENPKLTMDKDSVNKGLVISFPIDHLAVMGLEIPENKTWHVGIGYSIMRCPGRSDKCLMRIDDPARYKVQRISELYVTGIKELNALKVAIPDGYKVNVDHGYEVWKSHRHRKHTRYWIRILNQHDFNSRDLKKLLKCRGLNSEITSPDDSGDEEDKPLLPAESVIEKLESIAVQRLSEEQIRAYEDLKRKWTAQRQPPSEDPDVEYFESEKSKNAREISAWLVHCHSKGLGKQYLNVVREILEKHGNPRLVLEDNGIGRIASDEDGRYFIPDWNSPRAGPALESFLEVLENEQAQAYSELHSLEFYKFFEKAALEEDEYEAREASAFAMEKKKVDTQLRAIQHKIIMLEGKGGLSPEQQERRLRQLTMEHAELEKIEKSMRPTQNDYKRKRKQHDEQECQDRYEQKILRVALHRQHREEAEKEMMLRPQNAEEEAHRRRIILKRHKQPFSKADRSQFQGEILVPSGESPRSMVSSIQERLEKLERKIEIQKKAAKVEAGAAGAPEMPQNDGPKRLAGMFSQKLDEDLNDVRLRFLSLEP
jgi:hypothetical protein